MPLDTILIIEDDDGLVRLLREYLEGLGYPCAQVQSGTAAMEWVAKQRPALVLVDYSLPDMTAETLAASFSKHKPPLPFVVITGQGSEQVAVTMMKTGARDYLIKDATLLERLDTVIERALHEAHVEQRLADAEHALHESEERWKFALECTGQGVWDWNIQTKQAYFSPAWRALVGCSAAGGTFTRLEDWLDRIHPDDRVYFEESLRKHLAGETESFVCEHRLRSPDGLYRWFLSLGKVVARDAQQQPLRMIGTHSDITERRELTQRLRLAQKTESLGVMAAGVAHDFNNLLMVVLAHVDMLLKRTPAGDSQRMPLEEVKKAAIRAAELSRQMLTYTGKANVTLVPLRLDNLLQDLLNGIRATLAVSLTLRTELTSPLPEIRGDANQLRTLITSVVTNAREAISKPDGLITIRTSVTTLKAGDWKPAAPDLPAMQGTVVCLEVKDNGCGMDADTRERMFDPFFSTKFPGRGLGLPTVLGIIRSHGGAVTCTSDVGQGTTLRVVFPVIAEPTSTSQPVKTEVSESVGAGDRSGVLVIDDDPGIRNTVRRVLERAGYRVWCAESGAAGLDLLKQGRSEIGVVLLDLKMLQMDGEMTFTAIRELAPGLPVILSTGYIQEGRLRSLMMQGLAGVLEKPFPPRVLLDTVQNVLMKAAAG